MSNLQDTINQAKSALDAISVRWSEKSAEKIEKKINETAEKLAPIMMEKNLHLVKGSKSPSTQKSYQSLYLEYPNASHDSRHRAYANVIARYEWQTKSKYGFAPVPQREFFNVCDALIRKAQIVEAYGAEEDISEEQLLG